MAPRDRTAAARIASRNATGSPAPADHRTVSERSICEHRKRNDVGPSQDACRFHERRTARTRSTPLPNNLNYTNWTAHKKTQPTNASMGPSPVWGLMASAPVISSGSTARVTMYCVGVKNAL